MLPSDPETRGPPFRVRAPLRVHGRGLKLAAMAVVTIGLSASPARASIAFDASSNTTGAAVTSVSWSHTTANQANRYMVVGVVFSSNSRSISGVTYGSTSLSSLGSINKAAPFHCRAELFGGVPSAGTNTITVSFAGGTVNTVAGATTYYGVSAVVPQTGITAGTPSVTVTSTTGDYLVDLLCSAGALVPDPSQPNQVERWKAAVGGFAHGAASNRRGFATSTTMSWTNNDNFAYIPLRLRPMLLNAARVDAIGARRMPWGVRVGWRTGSELDNLGFNLYREQGGARVRLTSAPVLGSALNVGPGFTLRAGQTYGWNDLAPVDPAARYWLEVIDMAGDSRWHGPIAADSGPGDPLLLGPAPRAGAPEVLRVTPLPPAADVPPPRPAARQLAAPATRLKLRVQQEGWYRLAGAELLAAGMSADVDPRRLSLSREGRAVAMRVSGEGDGRLDRDDAIEFYGRGADTPWSDEGVYWLQVGPASGGQRITASAASLSAPAPDTSFRHTVERRERSFYFAALRNGPVENFFGTLVGPQPGTVTIDLTDADLEAPVDLALHLQGVSQNLQRVGVWVNGETAGEVAVDQRRQASLRQTLPGSVWREGPNEVSLRPLGGQGTVTALDRVRVSYARRLRLGAGALGFATAGGRTVALSGAAAAAGARAFDVSDPSAPVELAVQSRPAEDRLLVAVPAGVATAQVLVVPAGGERPGPPVEAVPATGWNQAREGADIVMIAPRAFIPGLSPLRQLREREGWSVDAAAIEDLYDDFSHGQKDPQAIRDLLRAARERWRRVPRFVLLVGDATFDPRNFLGQGSFDLVPTRLVDTAMLETASDEWFVAPPEGQAPDMVVGRLPVRDGSELDRVVAKIVAFGQGEGRERALLSYTDHDTEQDFEAIAGEMLSGLPAEVEVRWLRRREAGAVTREHLLRGLNDGPLVVSYAGHGSEDLWAGSVFTSADADLLTNRERPVVLLGMTCLNGVFHSVWKTGLAEAMLLAERGGAVAAFASSGLTHAADQVALNQHLLRGLLSPGLTLGEAILRAKAQTVDADVRNTWALLGDPAMRLLAGAGQGGDVNGVRDAGASRQLDGGASPAPTMVDGGATPALRRGCSYGPAGGGGWGTGALGLFALLAAAGAARKSRVKPPAAGS